MALKTKDSFPVLAAMLLLLFPGFQNPFPERPQTGFWAMEGELVTHHFEEKADSLSGPELFELRDQSGLPVWFGRYIFKDVCISGECKMIRLWLFWDGAGNYLGMQVPEKEPLTKSDHTLFEPEDYQKLESILRDTHSLLNDLEQEDLIIVPDSIDPYEVDGYTAATQPTLAEVVVKDAVYTCHTLWHTVYGPVQQRIREMLEERLSMAFLEKMFKSPKPEYISWAMASVEKFPEYHAPFYSQIMEYIGSENVLLANQALRYFSPELVKDAAIQKQLVQVMADAEMTKKYEILWKFIGADQVDQEVVLILLNRFYKEEIGVGAYNLILRLLEAKHLNENQEIARIMDKLMEHENGYVRNITQRKVEELE